MTCRNTILLCAHHDWLIFLVVTEFCCLPASRLPSQRGFSSLGNRARRPRQPPVPFGFPPPHHHKELFSFPLPSFLVLHPPSTKSPHLRCPPTRSPLPSLPHDKSLASSSDSPRPFSTTPPPLPRRSSARYSIPYPSNTPERRRSATCRSLLFGDWLPPRG